MIICELCGTKFENLETRIINLSNINYEIKRRINLWPYRKEGQVTNNLFSGEQTVLNAFGVKEAT
jgi:hypothetical protein